MKKQMSMTNQLFRIYTLLFLILFLVTATAAMVIMMRSINTGIFETQKRVANAITVSIDGYFADMNDFSVSLMNSDEFRQAVITELPAMVDDPAGQTEVLRRVYLSAWRMFEKGYRVGVATNGGTYIWLADQILVQRMDETPDLYGDYVGHGWPELQVLPANMFLSRIAGGGRSHYADTPVVSLRRSIHLNNQFLRPQAMLEVQVGLSEFEAFVDGLLGEVNVEQLHLSIFGSGGERLYGDLPLPEDGWKQTASQLSQWTRSGGDLVQWESAFGGRAWLCYQIPASAYYEKLWSFMSAAALIFLFLLLAMIYFTWRIARKVTQPLAELNRQLEQINLTEPSLLPKVETQFRELSQIAQTVSGLNTKLYHTMQQIMAMQTAEMQSRLMALQSQMQPHFLYNTLAVIGSLSQQGEKERVNRMCSSLSQVLRYVSAEQKDGVLLYAEIGFLKDYLMIMQERFPKAQVHVDIPLDMMDIRVPKLILQPLCENSFKYAGRNDIEITVTGETAGGRWRVQVKDNGAGFTEQAIEEILSRCRRLAGEQQLGTVSVDGMGLVNIYARLSIWYGDDFEFSIHRTEGVAIGGKRYAAEREDQGPPGGG